MYAEISYLRHAMNIFRFSSNNLQYTIIFVSAQHRTLVSERRKMAIYVFKMSSVSSVKPSSVLYLFDDLQFKGLSLF